MVIGPHAHTQMTVICLLLHRAVICVPKLCAADLQAARWFVGWLEEHPGL
jgi:hypothetical protein